MPQTHVITDSLLKQLVQALEAHPDAELSRPVDHETKHRALPGEIVSFLSAIEGWSYGDLRFTPLSDLETEREFWTELVTAFEAGRSESWEHAFWNPGWYPLATSSVDVFAYDPIGCFGGSPGQIVAFDFKGGESWVLFPSLGAWIEAFKSGLESGDDAVYASLQWATKHGGSEVRLPDDLDGRRSRNRFGPE